VGLGKSEKDRSRLGTVLYYALESIRLSGLLLAAFMPSTSEKIWAQSAWRKYLGAEDKGERKVGRPEARKEGGQPVLSFHGLIRKDLI